ncbi:MAG: nuclear transport factor 2 family protein [Pseudolabrys sp.]
MPRVAIETFYSALCTHDYRVVADYLADDVDWTISGPVEVLPYCGTFRGKEQVLAVLEQKVPETLGHRHIVPDLLLVDGDKAAALARLVADGHNGHTISYRVAQFFTVQDNKVVYYYSVADSFDAVEQVIGHRIEMPKSPALTDLDEDLFAV